jgi:hypothetical protein
MNGLPGNIHVFHPPMTPRQFSALRRGRWPEPWGMLDEADPMGEKKNLRILCLEDVWHSPLSNVPGKIFLFSLP